MKKKILVTCALPYANGPLHIGHMLEHIQADIWVRYKKMRGYDELWFICADDAHGTPIMLKAQSLEIKPEDFIKNIYLEHKIDLFDFNISYDNYYSTHSPENYFLLNKIYKKLLNRGLIKKRRIKQLFDCNKNMFLPDRFVKGSCPVCLVSDQYGDHCEYCGTSYSAIDLINPKSVLSKEKPILKDSIHFFFNLPFFEKMLREWISSGVLHQSVEKKLEEWFKIGLKEWDISRDSPYFGFTIPGYVDKFFYVWLDAPIGYISTFQNFCNKKTHVTFNEYWNKESNSELYHFIGKDIIYFHGLFWPAILEASDYRKPTKIFVHGHVTMNGLKLSKSKGLCISARTWLNFLDSDSLRYYYASKLSSKIKDIEVNVEHLIQKVNSDLVNKIVNLASRISKFLTCNFNNVLSSRIDDLNLYNKFVDFTNNLEMLFEQCEFSSVISNILKLASLANNYIDKKQPWIMNRDVKNRDILHDICTTVINLFRILMTWLKPIVPDLAIVAEKFLNKELLWSEISIPLFNHKIEKFFILRKRLDITACNF